MMMIYWAQSVTLPGLDVGYQVHVSDAGNNMHA